MVKANSILKDQLRQTVAKAMVTHIVDEQTLVLDNGMTIQLAGLYFVYNRNGKGPDALASYSFLEKEFKGKFVRVYQTRNESKGRKNGFQHEIAHLERIDGIWAQGSIVASGLGRVYIKADNPETAQELLAIEADARSKASGFWDNPAWSVRSADDINMNTDEFAIIEGSVFGIQQRQNNLYLNFAENWREDFTIQIPSEQRKLFSMLGKNPFDWAHKKMRVRGWVENYNGPMIKILHPAQIEFLDDKVSIEYEIMNELD
jgi:endonuclease YncB( thermonuclease family)